MEDLEYSTCVQSMPTPSKHSHEIAVCDFIRLILRVKSGCAVVIVRTSEALGNAQPRVAVASAPFEQFGIDIYFDFV